MKEYKSIVFSGGGILGTAYIGALQPLFERGLLKSVKRFAGASVGSIFAATLACGGDCDFLLKKFNGTDFRIFKDSEWNFVSDCYRLYMNYGYYSGDPLEKWCSEIVAELTGKVDITFLELYTRTGNELVIVATNFNRRKSVYFNKDTHPNLPIVKALRMSASYPIFFQPVIFENEYWVDGGLLDNYPVGVFDTTLEDDENTLGFKLTSSLETRELNVEEINLPPDSLKNYISALVDILHEQALRLHVKENDWKRTINIDTGNLSSLNFNLTAQQKQFLIENGKRATLRYLDIDTSSLTSPLVSAPPGKIEY